MAGQNKEVWPILQVLANKGPSQLKPKGAEHGVLQKQTDRQSPKKKRLGVVKPRPACTSVHSPAFRGLEWNRHKKCVWKDDQGRGIFAWLRSPTVWLLLDNRYLQRSSQIQPQVSAGGEPGVHEQHPWYKHPEVRNLRIPPLLLSTAPKQGFPNLPKDLKRKKNLNFPGLLVLKNKTKQNRFFRLNPDLQR